VSRLSIAIVTVKFVFAFTVPKLGGKTNFDDGMLFTLGITPIGAELQEPFFTCVPFVRGKLTVAQKLMKLLEDVAEAISPASGLNSLVPLSSKPVLIRELSSVNDDCASVELLPGVEVTFVAVEAEPEVAVAAGAETLAEAVTTGHDEAAATDDATAEGDGETTLEDATGMLEEAEATTDEVEFESVAPVAAMRC